MWLPMAGGVGRQQGRVLSTRDPGGGLIRDGHGWRGSGETRLGAMGGRAPVTGGEGASWGLAATRAEAGSTSAGGQCPMSGMWHGWPQKELRSRGRRASWEGHPGRRALRGQASGLQPL